MYEEQNLGDVTTALTSLIGPLATIFSGKPSDFRVFIFFRPDGHFDHTQGDKPNATTTQAAQAIAQAVDQFVYQVEAAGGKFNVPGGFDVNIGQRDPSYIWSPPQVHSDPYHGAPGSLGQIAAAGDANSVVNAIVNFLNQHQRQGTASGSATPTAMRSSTVPGAATTPLTSANLPQTVPSPSFAFPQTTAPNMPTPTPGFVPVGTRGSFNIPPNVMSPMTQSQIPITSVPGAPPYASPVGPFQSGSMFGDFGQYTPYLIGGAALLMILTAMKNQPASAAPPPSRRRPRRAS